MSQTGQRPGPLAVGVDLGGTWLRLVALRDGQVLRRTRRSIPVSELSKFLPALLGRRAPIASLVVAARGVWTPAERRAAARRLGRAAARVHVISDAEAALLGAHDGRPGLLVLAGTGSIVLGRDARGRLARAGGLGPLLGDEGSAFWLGREWLRLTPAAGTRARALGRRPDAVARVAALAPRVLARARGGDRRARAIVAAGQARLAALAADVIRRLRLRRPVSVSWGGSLLANAAYRAGVRRALARHAACRWQAPALDAALAAARLAARGVTRSRG
ncbi:MAG TPA: BadF/BadG/BcrA/BcrD ATPase family protein [Candidatus Binatia bacterium]|nr:BadF/BadG/BcrA/BcrD ATPase family protein [Candidatus Binatia bacterium]